MVEVCEYFLRQNDSFAEEQSKSHPLYLYKSDNYYKECSHIKINFGYKINTGNMILIQ